MNKANGTNGTHAQPHDAKPREIVVEVHRVRVNIPSTVVALSNGYGGCITHWAARSRYCEGEESGCTYCKRKAQRTWKGYAPVEVLDAENELWIPAVLEITENLEPELRRRWRRGTVWQLWMDDDGRGKRSGCMGKLVNELDPFSVLETFDVTPIVRRLFHVDSIDLSKPNPLPDRIVRTARPAKRVAEPPAGKPQPPAPAAEPAAGVRDRLNGMFRVPVEDRNGDGR